MISNGSNLITREIKYPNLRNYFDGVSFKRSSTEYAAISNLTGLDLGDSITLSQLAMREGITPEIISKFTAAKCRIRNQFE